VRRIVAAEYVSVDGRMQMEPPSGVDQRVGGWTAPFWDDELQTLQHELLFASDALLLGRRTYEGFAASWPSMTDEEGFAERMNNLPKFVASTSLAGPLEWNARLLDGNPIEEIRALKEEPGQDLLIYGSGTLVRVLLAHGLIDELRLMIHPVLLGWGKRLLDDEGAELTLTDSRVTAKGVAVLSYRVDVADTE